MQKRANHIATDLDKLKIALRDRGQILGVEVKQKIPKEMPFGECKILLSCAMSFIIIRSDV